MFSFRETRGPVDVAVTRRYAAGPPGGGLDLAEPADDAPDRDRRLAALGERLDVVAHALAAGHDPASASRRSALHATRAPVVVRVRQVHGADVRTVDRAWLDRDWLDRDWLGAGRRPTGPPRADGLVTDLPGVALLVRAADCVPVLLADVSRGVVGAAHAGRIGLVAGVVPATIERMRERGAEDLVAWLGPHICGRCYEVPAGMREEVAAAVPEAYAETSWGTPAVDVGAGVAAQLRAAGAVVVDASRCTHEHDDLWSHRRDGSAAGRLGALVWVQP